MSFYTSLTGLKAATTELALTSNNIANVGTSGFKSPEPHLVTFLRRHRCRSHIGCWSGCIPERGSTGILSGQRRVLIQHAGLGNFRRRFLLKSADGLTDIYTRNGSFVLNEQFNGELLGTGIAGRGGGLLR